ncbi:MAG: hypothetical protein JNG88_17895 [Phycisphaerales bacterium]|nr:hypothetical protein [Phycisphaerales bacterium]
MTMRAWTGAMCGGLMILSLGGCPQGDSCDSANPVVLIQAATKFANCGMQDLTTCELRVLAATVSELSPDVDITINEEQAQAAIDFLKANDVNCLTDLQQLIITAESNPAAIQIPDSLQQLIDSDIDIGSLIG